MEHPHERADRIKYRTDADEFPGSRAAQRRLSKFNGVMWMAWNDLELPMDRQAVEEYMDAPLSAVAKTEREKERILTIVMGFALVAIEADREERRLEAEAVQDSS